MLPIQILFVFGVIINNKYLFQFKDFKSLKSFSKNKIFKNHKNFDNEILLFSNSIKRYFYQIVLLLLFFYHISVRFDWWLDDNFVLESKEKWVYKEVS